VNPEDIKNWFEIAYYVVAIFAAAGAFWTYRQNSRREQSKWASTFYEKFYEDDKYKPVRDLLDCPTDPQVVVSLVKEESSEFTDYLNFFEHVAIFTESKQLNPKDVEDSFGYYLDCLENLTEVREYIGDKDKGYEQLRRFMEARKRRKALVKE
jgi:hypothetical protein